MTDWLSPNPMRRPTRLQELDDDLPARFQVHTWNPGDGVTRYRFFEDAPRNQSYSGPDNGIFTALGIKEAEAFAAGLGRLR